MTETALLCLFIYVPFLMMVIVWGDMTLDKERAHVASSYISFSPQRVSEELLVEEFFPFATGREDATLSVRTVSLEGDEAVEGPVYGLPTPGADYAGAPPPFDLQYKLYSLAAGEVYVTYELQAMPDGTVDFVARWERRQDEVARYLTRNEIVNVGPQEEGPLYLPVGEELPIETGAPSTSYTRYVEVLTDVFNGRWNAQGFWAGGFIGNAAPTLESRAALSTTFVSPFLGGLERGDLLGWSEGPDLEFPRVGGRPGFEMHFGTGPRVPEDDSFLGGYTYLRNPEAQISAGRVRTDMYELSDAMFSYPAGEGGEDLRLSEMPLPLSTERGEPHMAFLLPGDPRPSQQPAP